MDVYAEVSLAKTPWYLRNRAKCTDLTLFMPMTKLMSTTPTMTPESDPYVAPVF